MRLGLPSKILLVVLILTSTISFAPIRTDALRKHEIGPVTNPDVTPKAYIVVDAAKGTIITGKNIHEALNVASISKIITALGAINTLPSDKEITIPAEAEAVQPMRIGMKKDQKWKRDDLLYSLLLVSANDAAYALAQASAGSIAAFNRQQNRIATELSMKDSTFGDPSGLDDSQAISGETKMSAYDLAIAGRAVLAQKDLAKIVGTLNYQFVGGDGAMHTLTNHNDTFLTSYVGANGLKTGYTQKAGRTLMVSATQGGTTLIAVVLDTQQTNEWAKQLLDSSFASITSGSVAKNAPTLPAIGTIGSKANVTILKDPKTTIVKPDAPKINKEFLSAPLVSLIIILVIFIAVVLRRRAVIKRRKKRRMQMRSAQESSRRKMMHTIDLTIEDNSELISKK